MNTFLRILCLGLCMAGGYTQAQSISKTPYREDFIYFWETIRDEYAYWDKKQTDWNKVKEIFLPLCDTISSRSSFTGLLEKVFYELYDAHASLNTNTLQSQRLVPSGTDIWAAYKNDKPVIVEVRKGFGAGRSGLTAGMEIVALNDLPVEKAVLPFLPRSLKKADPKARDYALRVALAGNHESQRKITVKVNGLTKDYFPDQPDNFLENPATLPLLDWKQYPQQTGYIKINNSLGNNDLIPVFDQALDSLLKCSALILDLRETPGGGNTTVARAILSRFISKEDFYQWHIYPAEEKQYGIRRSWKELVSPRGKKYKGKLIVLVNHWTGSVGEGIAIGFHGLKRGLIAGAGMAGLNGANYSYTLPHSRIGFSFPAEQLLHINGTPREQFIPAMLPGSGTATGDDLVLQHALREARKR